MSKMTTSDVELVYKHLNDRVRGDLVQDAYSKTLSRWRDERADDLDALEDANEDDESSFEWEGIDMQSELRDPERGDELVPMTGMEPEDDSGIRDLAHEFALDYLKTVRVGIEDLQEETMYSPREFVALVLYYQLQEDRAASAMGISVGNYRGKLGKISDKRERAESTVKLSEKLTV